ncbi:hypothetical protein [Paraburkholderia fungorum]
MANTTPPPVSSPLKQLSFAFPFRRKGQGATASSADFTDEHEFYKVLEAEPSGNYSVSAKGMWHGGVHVTEAGAGRSLDLKYGVRCLADGEVIAYRVDRAYPLSELPAQNGTGAISAPYSTGFTLVRHSMEFPRGTTLTFYSLYMHLQDLADYERDTTLSRPAYWSKEFEVTAFAQDRPDAGANGQTAPAEQMGLRIRATRRTGTILGILPQGARVVIGARADGWGQITDSHGADLYPKVVGDFVSPDVAANGWIFLGKEHGGPVVTEGMPELSLDRVVVLTEPFRIKAGELIGHLGRYDSLSPQTSSRMVHIEVFCDDTVKTFITQGQAWIASNGAHEQAWQQLGLPKVPTILRVDRNTTLYHLPGQQGQHAKQTGVIQVASFAGLARQANSPSMEATAGTDGRKLNWWHVDSADALGRDISGWVREDSFAGGRVTREFAQKWVDFKTLEDPHDPTHTMFATTQAYVDYSIGADVADAGSRDKLSQLMQKIYDTLPLTGDSNQAADRLHDAAENPWVALRMSRLIIRHESEWANPDKWKRLIAEIEKKTGPQPQHEAELERIEKLVWWDEVKACLADLPAPDVFHIHPIALVGNFLVGQTLCACGCCLQDVFKVTRYGHAPNTHYGPVFWGERALDKSKVLTEMRASGVISESEYRIIVAMSKNEGMLDAVQSYDSEAVTAGAMQKTINSMGKGEFPIQVAEFKASNASEYSELFERCGWTVEGIGPGAQMFYSHSELTQGQKITGGPLKDLMRRGCSAANFGQKVKSVPLAVIAHAITSRSYETKQLMDFLSRLRDKVLPATPRGYHYTIAQYFQSDLGRAAALDQSVNRPGYVTRDIGKALDALFSHHPELSRNPDEWGSNRAQYEREVVGNYGNSREMSRDSNGLNSAPRRFGNLTGNLG